MIKAVIIMTVVIVFFAATVGIFSSGCIDQRPSAEVQARAWSKDMGLNLVNVSCANRDTDNDGYVSCTVSVKDEKGNIALHPIECAAKMTWNDGCRSPKMRMYPNGAQ